MAGARSSGSAPSTRQLSDWAFCAACNQSGFAGVRLVISGYPIATASLVMGPRGFGMMVAMLVVGKLIGRTDTRLLLGIGLALTAWSFCAMASWTPDVSQATSVVVGVVQGVGLCRLSANSADPRIWPG
jgi:MFS family permease